MDNEKGVLTDGQTEIFFFILDVRYETMSSGRPQIKIFGVTEDKKSVLVKDKNFDSYFYAILKPDADVAQTLQKLRSLEIKRDAETVKIKDTAISNKNLLKKQVKVIKIIADHPNDISILQDALRSFDEISARQEADIKFYRRYLVDKNLIPCTLCKAVGNLISGSDADIILGAQKVEQANTDLMPQPKSLAFDIETLCSGTFPSPKSDSIITISFYGSDGFKKAITWKRFPNAPDYVTFVDGELKLLEEFIKTIKQFKPEFIVGYGSDSFDFPFILERCQKYKTKLDLGLNGSEILINANGAGFAGLVHIDILHFIGNILGLETERLDLVAKELLRKDKLSYPKYPKKINELWEVGLEDELSNLIEYKLNDAQLIYELFLNVLPTQLQLVKLIGLPPFDIARATYGKLVEEFLIKNCSRFGQLILRRPEQSEIIERRRQTYSGGFVVEPRPNLYKNVCVFDFKSSYPQIIAAHNISPETINCECCRYKGGHHITEDLWFCSKEKGFMPELVQEIIERRRRILAILEKTSDDDPARMELSARAHALKYVAVSFYGYLGFSGARWYSLDCAKAITLLGRNYIQMVIKEGEKFGFEVLYSDTDSVFILLKDKLIDDAKKFLSIINSILPSPMELEYRDFYPSALFLGKKDESGGAKKRYALLTKNGNLILRGLESIRGDWSELAKNCQKEVLNIILKEGNVEEAVAYVQKLIQNVKERKVDLNDLIIKVRLTKSLNKYVARTPYVLAGELAAQKGHDVGEGFVVSYIIKGGENKISERVLLAEDAHLQDYDPEYYCENQILRTVYKVFEIFGYTDEKLKSGQTTLGGWNGGKHA